MRVFVCAIAVFSVSCARHETHASSPPAVAYAAVAKVTTDDLARNLVLTAEFHPFQEIDVMAKVAGYIKQINVDAGDRVKQGQLLAVLEIPEMADDLRRAQASVEHARAEVARARDDLARAESTHQFAHLAAQRLATAADRRPGLIAQQEIDDAHGRDLVAEAQIASAKSALAAASEEVQVRDSDVAKVKTLMEYRNVYAPFAGVITKRFADTGSMIQAGTASQTQAMPVVRLSENSMLRLILPVPESAVPGVHIGQQVEVRVPTLKRNFSGHVARFSERVASATRTMDTEVDVPNPSMVLIPGMYAEVDLALERRDRVTAVPVTAVDAKGEVLVVNDSNRIEMRKVVTGMESADRVEVKSGLKPGELVVVAGRAGFQPGQEVKPKLTEMAAAKE
jgi:RND family efflux transporter MFP subunit